MRKITPGFFKNFCVFILLLFMNVAAYAQTAVSGKVMDANGVAIAGATVTAKGSSAGTSTDANGNFSLTLPAGATTLVVSAVGHATQELAINGQTNFSVSLSTAASELNEVVVVGYGTRKKSDLTGSVVALGEKEFQKGNINSSEQLLQGKVAGLEVTTGGGSAGGGSKIRIRGSASLNASNDPLIVIDGVPVEGNGISGSGNLLNTINPNDIESMSVLKDASATALYGSRATNGVIIITTKKGTSNKVVYNFNTKYAISTIPENRKVKVLSGDQIRQIVTESGVQRFIDLLGDANTDWQDQIYQNATGWDNNLSASGRAQIGKSFRLPFRISGGYLTQEGLLRTNKFDRLTASLNLSPKFLDDHLSFNINAKFAQTKNRFADEGAIGTAVNYDPTQSVYSGDTKFGGYYEWYQPGSTTTLNGLAPLNPLGMLNQRDNRSTVDRFIGNVQVDYKMHFLPDLHLLLNLGMDKTKGSGNDRWDSTSANSIRNFSSKGFRTQYGQKKDNKMADIQLFYEKDLKNIKSKIDILVGHGYQEFFTDNLSYANFYLTGDSIPGTRPDFPLVEDGFAIESYLGRLNYNYDDKYLLTASIRRDESSKFSKENRVGYFPAVAFAWRLKNDFFRSSSKISELKLRLGWGQTGQQDGISNNSYLPLYYLATPTAQYQFGDVYYQPYRPVDYNSQLVWETNTTTNLGLDFGFINNRISGSVDVYQKKSKDLLSTVDIAPGAGFNIQRTMNVGSLENKGIEIAINTIPVRTQNLTWEIGGNFTYQETEITNLNGVTLSVSGISGGTGNNVGVLAVGYEPYTYNVYQQVYDAAGKPIEGLYEDRNRDGQITDADRRYFKKPTPDFLFGFSTNLTYKKFSLGLAGHGQAGNYLYNNYNSNSAVLRNINNPVNYIGNAGVDYLKAGFSNNQFLSDYYIENASFFRLDNINLGYNFGSIMRNKASLRLNASIQNVFVITKYSGADPENSSTTGVDNNIYPRPTIYSLGANINF